MRQPTTEHALLRGFLYHGSRQAYNPASREPIYLTQSHREAEQFAYGLHLGGKGRYPQVHRFKLKLGPVRDINRLIQQLALEGDGDIDAVVAQEVRKGNARYLTFTHPSALRDAEDFPVVIALYPHEDLIWKEPSGAGIMSPFFEDLEP